MHFWPNFPFISPLGSLFPIFYSVFMTFCLSFWFTYVGNFNFFIYGGKAFSLEIIFTVRLWLPFQKQIVLWTAFTYAKHSLMYWVLLLWATGSPEYSLGRPLDPTALVMGPLLPTHFFLYRLLARNWWLKFLFFFFFDKWNKIQAPTVVWTGSDRHSGNSQSTNVHSVKTTGNEEVCAPSLALFWLISFCPFLWSEALLSLPGRKSWKCESLYSESGVRMRKMPLVWRFHSKVFIWDIYLSLAL